MLFLVTGPDNSGKTTLISKLEKDLGLPIAKRYHPLPPDSADDYYSYCCHLVQNAKFTHWLADRGIIDEFVYGPLLRGTVIFKDRWQINELLRLLNNDGYVQFILCQPPISNQLQTFGERDQLAGTLDSILSINAAFDNLHNWPLSLDRDQIWKYDYTQPGSYEQLRSKIKGRL